VLPDDLWVTDVSTSFLEATLRLLTGVPRGDHALGLGEVRAERPEQVADAIRNHPDISGYDQLYAGERRIVGQYDADEKGLDEFLWDADLSRSSRPSSRTGRWSST